MAKKLDPNKVRLYMERINDIMRVREVTQDDEKRLMKEVFGMTMGVPKDTIELKWDTLATTEAKPNKQPLAEGQFTATTPNLSEDELIIDDVVADVTRIRPRKGEENKEWGDLIVNALGSGLHQLTASMWNVARVGWHYHTLPIKKIMPEKDLMYQFLNYGTNNADKIAQNLREKYIGVGQVKEFIGMGLEATPQVAFSLLTGNYISAAGFLKNYPHISRMMGFATFSFGQYELAGEKMGQTIDKASLYGLTMALAEMGTESAVFNQYFKYFNMIKGNAVMGKGLNVLVKKCGGIQQAAQFLKTIWYESAQEAAIEPIDGITQKLMWDAEKAMYGKNGVVDPGAIIQAAKGGASMSMILGGLAMPMASKSYRMADMMVSGEHKLTAEQLKLTPATIERLRKSMYSELQKGNPWAELDKDIPSNEEIIKEATYELHKILENKGDAAILSNMLEGMGKIDGVNQEINETADKLFNITDHVEGMLRDLGYSNEEITSTMTAATSYEQLITLSEQLEKEFKTGEKPPVKETIKEIKWRTESGTMPIKGKFETHDAMINFAYDKEGKKRALVIPYDWKRLLHDMGYSYENIGNMHPEQAKIVIDAYFKSKGLTPPEVKDPEEYRRSFEERVQKQLKVLKAKRDKDRQSGHVGFGKERPAERKMQWDEEEILREAIRGGEEETKESIINLIDSGVSKSTIRDFLKKKDLSEDDLEMVEEALTYEAEKGIVLKDFEKLKKAMVKAGKDKYAIEAMRMKVGKNSRIIERLVIFYEGEALKQKAPIVGKKPLVDREPLTMEKFGKTTVEKVSIQETVVKRQLNYDVKNIARTSKDEADFKSKLNKYFETKSVKEKTATERADEVLDNINRKHGGVKKYLNKFLSGTELTPKLANELRELVQRSWNGSDFERRLTRHCRRNDLNYNSIIDIIEKDYGDTDNFFRVISDLPWRKPIQKIYNVPDLPRSLITKLQNANFLTETQSGLVPTFAGKPAQHMYNNFILQLKDLKNRADKGLTNVQIAKQPVVDEVGKPKIGEHAWLIERPHGHIVVEARDLDRLVKVMYVPRDVTLKSGELTEESQELVAEVFAGRKAVTSLYDPSLTSLNIIYDKLKGEAKENNLEIRLVEDTYRPAIDGEHYLRMHAIYIWDEIKARKILEDLDIECSPIKFLEYGDKQYFYEPSERKRHYKRIEGVSDEVFDAIFKGERFRHRVVNAEGKVIEEISSQVFVNPKLAIEKLYGWEEFMERKHPEFQTPLYDKTAQAREGIKKPDVAEQEKLARIARLTNEVVIQAAEDEGNVGRPPTEEQEIRIEAIFHNMMSQQNFSLDDILVLLQKIKQKTGLDLTFDKRIEESVVEILDAKKAEKEERLSYQEAKAKGVVAELEYEVKMVAEQNKGHHPSIARVAREAIKVYHYWEEDKMRGIIEELAPQARVARKEGWVIEAEPKEKIVEFLTQALAKETVERKEKYKKLGAKRRGWAARKFFLDEQKLRLLEKWGTSREDALKLSKEEAKDLYDMTRKKETDVKRNKKLAAKRIGGWSKGDDMLLKRLHERYERDKEHIKQVHAQRKAEKQKGVLDLSGHVKFKRNIPSLSGLKSWVQSIKKAFDSFKFYPSFKNNKDRNDIRLVAGQINQLIEEEGKNCDYQFGGMTEEENYHMQKIILHRSVLSRMMNYEKFKYPLMTEEETRERIKELVTTATPAVLDALDRFKEIGDIFKDNMIMRGDLYEGGGLDWYVPMQVEKYADHFFTGPFPGFPTKDLRKKVRHYLKKPIGSGDAYTIVVQEDDPKLGLKKGDPYPGAIIEATVQHQYQVMVDNTMDTWFLKKLQEDDRSEDLTTQQKIEEFGTDRQGRPKNWGKPNHVSINPFKDGVDYECYQFNRGLKFKLTEAFQENREGELLIRKLIEVLGTNKTYFIPADKADAYRKFGQPESGDILRPINRYIAFWKQSAITATAIGFNFNNMLGDMFILSMQWAKPLTRTGYGLEFMWKSMVGNKEEFTQEDKETDAFCKDQDVLEAGLIMSEIAPYVRTGKGWFPSFFNAVRSVSVGREGIMRAAVARTLIDEYKNKLNEHMNLPEYSINALMIPELIEKAVTDRNGEALSKGRQFIEGFNWIDTKGLGDYDALGMIARTMMIDYASLSRRYNSWIRGMLFPFMTWYHKASVLLVKKMYHDPVRTLMKMSLPFIAGSLYNYTRFPEEEGEGPSWIRSKPHVWLTHKDRWDEAWCFCPQLPLDVLPLFPLLNITLSYAGRVANKEMDWKEAAERILTDFSGKSVQSVRFLTNAIINMGVGLTTNRDNFGRRIYPGAPLIGGVTSEKDVHFHQKLPYIAGWMLECALPPISIMTQAEKDTGLDYVEFSEYGQLGRLSKWIWRWGNFPEAFGVYKVNLSGKREEMYRKKKDLKRDYNSVLLSFMNDWTKFSNKGKSGELITKWAQIAYDQYGLLMKGSDFNNIMKHPFWNRQRILEEMRRLHEAFPEVKDKAERKKLQRKRHEELKDEIDMWGKVSDFDLITDMRIFESKEMGQHINKMFSDRTFQKPLF